MQTLLRTPLYERHVALGARMVPFAGWEMPVQYEGVIPEHHAVREDCGIFDVSHMGRFEFEGPKAPGALPALLSNDPETGDRRRREVHPPDDRAGRNRGRLVRLPARARPLPPLRQRVDPEGRFRLDRGAGSLRADLRDVS